MTSLDEVIEGVFRINTVDETTEGRQACLDAIKELKIDIIAVGHGPVINLRA